MSHRRVSPFATNVRSRKSRACPGRARQRPGRPGRRLHSPTSPTERMTVDRIIASTLRDEKIIRQRLDQQRGQLLQWGTPDLVVFVTTKDELRGWIRALEWVLMR